MRPAVALVNLALGLIYTGYGIMTVADLVRDGRRLGISHFGLAWTAMAFTCGPHHVEHAAHILASGRNGGPLDLLAVLIGAPAGLIWFSLRVEALLGGRGDRFIPGTPHWVTALPYLFVSYIVVIAVMIGFTVSHAARVGPRLTPNLVLLGLYVLIGYYLLRTQLANHSSTGGWSLSGLSLTLVFPTCGVMHTVFFVYAATGRYNVDVHGLVIDWLAVPAAVYFVWVVRRLHFGQLRDWNGGATGVRLETVPA